MKIYLHEPVGDLAELFWRTAKALHGDVEQVASPEGADIAVIDDRSLIPLVHEHSVDVVVVGVERPVVPEYPNVFYIDNYKRYQWFIRKVAQSTVAH